MHNNTEWLFYRADSIPLFSRFGGFFQSSAGFFELGQGVRWRQGWHRGILDEWMTRMVCSSVTAYSSATP